GGKRRYQRNRKRNTQRCKDSRIASRQNDVNKQCLLAGSEREGRPEQHTVDGARWAEGTDNHGKHKGKADKQNLRHTLNAKPQNEYRQKSNFGGRKTEGNKRVQQPVHGGTARHQHAEENPERGGQGEASDAMRQKRLWERDFYRFI